MSKKVNRPVVALGVLWWLMETSYFGWNASAGSTAELFADGLALVFFAVAFAFPRRSGQTIVIVGGHR
jgi:hypothetical protein